MGDGAEGGWPAMKNTKVSGSVKSEPGSVVTAGGFFADECISGGATVIRLVLTVIDHN